MQLPVGEQLKSAREAKNATIEQASNATHIRQYFIEAIEEGRYSDIPSNAQLKGFIRLYADWLNLPIKQILNAYDGIEEELLSPAIVLTSEILIKEQPSSTRAETGKTKESAQAADQNPTSVVSGENHQPDSGPEDGHKIEFDSVLDTSSLGLFQEIGQQLHSCRVRLGISVEDIEKITHIRSRYLTAMESGQFNDIPSLVQARGLLSGYSTYLNLDTDNLLSIFADALQKRRIEIITPELEKTRTKKKAAVPASERTGFRRFFTVDLIIGSVVIVGLVGFGLWAAAQVMSSGELIPVSKAPPISAVLLNNPTIVPVTGLTMTIEPTELVRNPDLIGQVPTSASSGEGASPNGSPTSPIPSLGDAAMQVYIVPNQRVFLQVTVGKKVVFSGRTIPGNAYPFTGDERIEVVSGNAAALQIYYNQRDLGTLGLPGETLRLIFSKEGITTPTPVKTAAPSATALPTLTLLPPPTFVPPTVTPLIP
ncbi:MAG: RodZ domain-containing protein [Leptolinea sp.]